MGMIGSCVALEVWYFENNGLMLELAITAGQGRGVKLGARAEKEEKEDRWGGVGVCCNGREGSGEEELSWPSCWTGI